jgi:histidinol phosphatase-like enzyme
MIRDSISDMEFGKNLGMKTVFVGNMSEHAEINCLLNFNSLIDFYKSQIIV